MTCTRERLIALSDWLNDNLDFESGEDFDKLSDTKRLTGEDDELCKTDRKTVAKWLDFMADLVPQLPNGDSLQMQNNARRMRLLSKKLTR